MNVTAFQSPLMLPHSDACAVIDIGSHSVRMVVYHAPVRVPLPVFNEKYYCSLGSGLAQTGRLNSDGKEKALAVLARFVMMAKRLDIDAITVLGTAAVRDAEDGADFVADIEARYGLRVEVISGEREAELAANGIIASMHHPKGVSADLGGGSIELAHIDERDICRQSSFKLGALRMADLGDDVPAMQAMIDESLGSLDWLSQTDTNMIYAIGGSFRTIAKMHMRRSNYPLSILHEYMMSKRSVDEAVALFKSLPPAEIAALPGIPTKRAATMLPASLILQSLMRYTNSQHVVFSVSGIREGLLYDRLADGQKQEDPLFASAADLALLAGRHGGYADELFDWMSPLFVGESEGLRRLRRALCMLSELAWTVDPNFRSDWAYYRVMQSSIKGLNHKERVMLALALFHRYQVKWKHQEKKDMQLLDESERLWSKCIGVAANLAFHLSGGKQGNLYHARLELSGTDVELVLDEEANPMRTEALEKRLEGLGSSFKALSNFLM